MMDYVAQSVQKSDRDVTIISPAQSDMKYGRIYDKDSERYNLTFSSVESQSFPHF